MLENDIVLTRYLNRADAAGRRISEQDVATLDRLLDMNDNALWDLLSGRADADDDEVQRLVRQLRSL